jgi:hypothetical protein
MPLLRFHWDFFGPDAETTAKHFLKHIDDFCARNGIRDYEHGITRQVVRCTAVLECDEQHLKVIREALRPVRGERVLED